MPIVFSGAGRFIAAACLLFATVAESRDLAPADRAVLEGLVVRSDAAWNERDAAALADLYAGDATLRVGSREQTLIGAAAIRDYFSESLARTPPDLRHETTLIGLHVLDADVVIADTTVELISPAPDGSRHVVRRFTTPTIVVRSGREWKLGAVRAQVIPEPKPARG
ncbi:MAG: hypothetical protein AMXMBFR59_21220 [Rhodanobacteraceae bacterium]